MDFILKKIENRLLINDPDSYDYITFLKLRIEYSLFLCLGFLWKNIDQPPQQKRNEIFSNLNNLSIGSVVSAIRELDRKDHKIFPSKKSKGAFDNYELLPVKRTMKKYKIFLGAVQKNSTTIPQGFLV